MEADIGNCSLDWTVFREMLDVWVTVNCIGGRASTLWFWGLLSFEHLLGDRRPPRLALLKRLPAHVVLRNYRKEAGSLLPPTHAVRKQMFMNTGRKREKKQRVQGGEEEDQLVLDQRMSIGVAVLAKENKAELNFQASSFISGLRVKAYRKVRCPFFYWNSNEFPSSPQPGDPMNSRCAVCMHACMCACVHAWVGIVCT